MQETGRSQSVAEGQGLNDAIVGRKAKFLLGAKDVDEKAFYK